MTQTCKHRVNEIFQKKLKYINIAYLIMTYFINHGFPLFFPKENMSLSQDSDEISKSLSKSRAECKVRVLREHDHIASDLFNIHESDREMKPDVYVSKAAHVEGFPKSFENIGGTISGQNRLSLTNIYYYVEKLNCIIVLI